MRLAWLLTTGATLPAFTRRRFSGSIACHEPLRFACPTCQSPLQPLDGGGLRCANGHFINVAKEGHIHLLPPQKKRALDVQAAIEARVRAERAFHEGGGYFTQGERVAAEINRALSLCPENDDDAHILNIGCGEGFYMRMLAREWAAAGRSQRNGMLFGTDTRKLAVRYAAMDIGF